MDQNDDGNVSDDVTAGASASTSKRSRRRSEWWEFYDKITVGDTVFAQCKYCTKRYVPSGTGNMRAHIENIHGALVKNKTKVGKVSCS